MLETLREKDVIAPSKKEMLWGILCWVMFELGFPLILTLIFDTETAKGAYWFQIAYFICTFLLTGGLFFKYLGRSSKPLRGNAKNVFFAVVQGFAMYFVLTLLFEGAVTQILYHTDTRMFNPNQEMIEGILEYSMIPVAICSVLLVPVTEELLVRGMVFAPLCRKWPWLAYLVSTLLFAGMHTLSFAMDMTFLQGLTSFLLYIPAGLVMGWIFQKTQSILGPIFLHMVLNFIAIFG